MDRNHAEDIERTRASTRSVWGARNRPTDLTIGGWLLHLLSHSRWVRWTADVMLMSDGLFFPTGSKYGTPPMSQVGGGQDKPFSHVQQLDSPRLWWTSKVASLNTSLDVKRWDGASERYGSIFCSGPVRNLTGGQNKADIGISSMWGVEGDELSLICHSNVLPKNDHNYGQCNFSFLTKKTKWVSTSK